MKRDLVLFVFWTLVLVAVVLAVGNAMDHTIATYYHGR